MTLALGGGGARGLAHIGAIQAIWERRLAVRRIVGVSIGSLVGGMLATDANLPRVRRDVLNYLGSDDFASRQEALFGVQPGKSTGAATSGLLAWYDQIKSYLWAHHLLSRVYRRRALLGGHVLEEVISRLIPDIDIQETVIPLTVVTVDLKTGHPVLLERGSLRRAIVASAAIPGIFPPVEWDGMLLCDLGVLDSLPAQFASSYDTGLVVGVDVGPSIQVIDHADSALHILLRIDEVGERLFRRDAYRHSDVLIRPEVGDVAWFDFSRPQELIDRGLHAGRRALRGLRRAAEVPRHDLDWRSQILSLPDDRPPPRATAN